MPRWATSHLALAVGAAVTAACISACGASRPAPPPSQPVSYVGLPLRQVADLALPDNASRFDYESFGERGRLLVTLGQKFLATEAHTVAVDPETHLVYFALQDVGGKPVLRIMAPVR